MAARGAAPRAGLFAASFVAVMLVAVVLGVVGGGGLASPALAQAPPATLRLDPAETEPGGAVQASGEGWQGECQVDLALDGAGLGSVTPSNGAFTVRVDVPPDTAPGPHRVVATGREFSSDDVGPRCAGPSDSEADAPLQVLAPPTPELELSAESIEFGSVALGSRTGEQVVAANIGSGRLTITAVQLAGGDTDAFAVTDDGCGQQTLPAGSSCAFTVVFEPTRDGQAGAELAVASDDPASPHLVAVAGTSPPDDGTTPPDDDDDVLVVVDPDNLRGLLWPMLGLLALIGALALRPHSSHWVRTHVAVRARPQRPVEVAVDVPDGDRSHAVRIVARPDTGTQTVHEVIP